MPEHQFQQHDLVILHPDYARPDEQNIVYRITRVLKVNLVAQPVSGQGVGLRARPHAFLPAPAEVAAKAIADAAARTDPAAQVASVVTVNAAGWREPAGVRYVILRMTPTTAALAVLGGTDSRLWPKVPLAWLTVVDPATLQPASTA